MNLYNKLINNVYYNKQKNFLNNKMEVVKFFLWFIIALIILITFYLTFIYIRLRISFHNIQDKYLLEIRSYPCYLNIILCVAIAIDNLSRLVTNKKNKFFCGLQAFVLAFSDKLIFTTITVNSYLTYRGLSDNEYYMTNIKIFFIITNSISLAIALILAIIFTCNGITIYNNVCYVEGGSFKENIDTVASSILYLIFLYSNLKSIFFLLKNIKELTLNKSNITAHLTHFYRMMVALFLCSAAFLVTLLIINDSLFVDDDFIDLCFIVVCLILALFYTLNSTVIKQTLILFRCREEEKEIDFYDTEENEVDDGREGFMSAN